MHRVCLFGAGKIGATIVALLAGSKRYQILVCDKDIGAAKQIAQRFPGSCEARALTIDDATSVRALLKGALAVVSALPFHCNTTVATLAVECGVHYFDLTEDVETTKSVMRLSKPQGPCLMPQCGLAPGFISIAAAHLARSFDSIESLKLRVGALPVFPSNRLKYCLTWSTEGLINEYANMCEAVENGAVQLCKPLEGYEQFALDGVEYEAFNTSGGLGSLADSFAGKVDQLNYKTIRYPGHRDLIAFLFEDLKFASDREALKKIFERSLPHTLQDKCIIFVEARGMAGGRLAQRTYASTVYSATVGEQTFGAIQITTAAGICAPLDMLLTGALSKGGARHGFVRCEEISLVDFLNNEFGRFYRDDKALAGLG